ncbi:MAG: peptide-methionine (R)-S-oxide reductase MsrB [Pseudomonadales bacterium]|nr:peptide-methionine (R)-S-oxide reductase MsrB [Pseudomonadales bacterium]
MTKMIKSKEQWLKELGQPAFHICREGGTEGAFSGEYWDCKSPGVYECRACGQDLFNSAAKYDSGSGWPSYFQPVNDCAVVSKSDDTLGMKRVEVTCSRCDSHLGHVFEDGPQPTGLRFCINSASLLLVNQE